MAADDDVLLAKEEEYIDNLQCRIRNKVSTVIFPFAQFPGPRSFVYGGLLQRKLCAQLGDVLKDERLAKAFWRRHGRWGCEKGIQERRYNVVQEMRKKFVGKFTGRGGKMLKGWC